MAVGRRTDAARRRIAATGRIAHRDGDIAAIEEQLIDRSGTIIPTAASTARVISLTSAASAV
jgi:hypothetical protein